MALLKERIRRIEEWRAAVTEHYVPEDGPEQLGHIGEIMNLWVHTADADAAWTRGLIARVEGGAYTFAGEGEPFVGVLGEDEENPYATGSGTPRTRAEPRTDPGSSSLTNALAGHTLRGMAVVKFDYCFRGVGRERAGAEGAG